jgi:hypothetical protein
MNTHTPTLIAAHAAALIALFAAPALTSCATLKPHIAKALPHLKEAIQDIDVEGIAKDHACGIYISKGRDSAEAIFANEWPIFEPVFKTPPNAHADLHWCRDSIKSMGVEVMAKPVDRSSTALCDVVFFGAGFEGKSVEEQAATCQHELVHLLGQQRMGCKEWLIDYAHVSGRLAAEGTAYALSDAALARYGVPEEKIQELAADRAKRFPASYKLSNVLDSECVADYFGAIRRALRERAGA